MNINTMNKRLSSKEKTIRQKIHRYSKWSVLYPKNSYLKALIVEEQEKMDALYRAYKRNFYRRIKVLESILTKEVAHETTYNGLIGKWKLFRLNKLKEEYKSLLEVSQNKYIN